MQGGAAQTLRLIASSGQAGGTLSSTPPRPVNGPMPLRDENRILRFLLVHCLTGIAVGWMLVGALLFINAGGLADLVFGSDIPGLALAMLLGANALTFGSLAMGTGLMSMPYDDGRPRRGRQIVSRLARLLAVLYRPVPAVIRPDRR